MSKISLFFKDNEKDLATEEIVVSERFLDEKKQPIKWKIRQLPQTLVDQLKKDCTTTTKKRGNITSNIDDDKLYKSMIIEAVVDPNLKDKELLKNRGFIDPKKMLADMLHTGEYATLNEAVLKLNKLDDEEVIEEVKN